MSGRAADRILNHPGTLRAMAAGLVFAAFLLPSARAEPGLAHSRPGTVDTLAGPGFCAGPAERNDEDGAVRALAVEDGGRVVFETGPPGAGSLGIVHADGRVYSVRTGMPAGRRTANPRQMAAEAPRASRLAADGGGGLFIAAGSGVVRLVAPVVPALPSRADAQRLTVSGLTVVAGRSPDVRGDAPAVSSGDGGPALHAGFTSARSVASDRTGNVFVADQLDARTGAFRVRFVNRGREPATLYGGTPEELTVAPGGIDTIVGTGPTGATGAQPPDGRLPAARTAALRGVPPAMAVDGAKLYIATSWTAPRRARPESTVQVVNLGSAPVEAHGLVVPAGGLATVLGENRPVAGNPDGAEGTGRTSRTDRASLISAISVDDKGDLLAADEQANRVLRLDHAGVVTTLAGMPGRSTPGFNGNDRPANGALLNRPVDVEIGPGNRIYVSDQDNGQIRFIDEGGTIRLLPGSGVASSWRCVGADTRSSTLPGVGPQAGGPIAVVAGEGGGVYVANADGGRVQHVGSPRRVRPVPLPVEPPLRRPTAVLRGGGGFYVLDGGNARVLFANRSTGPVTAHGVPVPPGATRTVAGTGEAGHSGDGGPATGAALGAFGYETMPLSLTSLAAAASGPATFPAERASRMPFLGSLAVDSKGNLFVTDWANRRIRMVDPAGIITTFAGEGGPEERVDCCRDSVGLAVDGQDNLYVSDRAQDPTDERIHPRVWVINRTGRPSLVLGQRVPAEGAVPVAGSGRAGIGGDGGPAVEAELQFPSGIAVDRGGSLYIASGNDVRKVDPTGTIDTLVGNGQGGFNGDGLKGKATSLSVPTGLAFDRCGNLLIADLGNDRVRRMNLVGACGDGADEEAAGRGDADRDGPSWAPFGLLAAGTAAAVAALTWWRARRRAGLEAVRKTELPAAGGPERRRPPPPPPGDRGP